MSSLTIVAIPAQDDYVYKISSEKVPHMTLLFLGEDVNKIKNLNLIMEFVKHAADTSLMQFGMEVDRRGELGPDKADVLFFSKAKWSGFETINHYRSNLLKNNNIKTAYDSTVQFPEFIPHLTLGYPDNPAKPDERDHPGISYVKFDRIAVWFKEYEGIEFPLKTYSGDMAVGMSDATNEVIENVLTHFGKKGMRWGVRNSRSSSNPSRRTRRADKKFEKKAQSLNTKIKINNEANAALKGHMERINAKFYEKYKKEMDDGVLLNSEHRITKAYLKEYNDVAMTEVNKVASSMTNKSGTKTYKAVRNPDDFLGYTIITKEINHSNDEEIFKLVYIKDDKGKIIDIRLENNDLVQSSIDDILAHYGTKGMKWGVRKSSSVTVSDKGKKLKTSGGYRHPAHPDALRARRLGQVGKKSGLKALSNQDLQAYSQRLQLEQSVKRLNYNEMNPGKKFVATILGNSGKSLASEGVNRGTKEAGKRALKLAMA